MLVLGDIKNDFDGKVIYHHWVENEDDIYQVAYTTDDLGLEQLNL